METKPTDLYVTSADNSITMKGSGLVTINTSIKIYGTGTELPIKIVADFNNVPHNLHEKYLQSLIYKYNTSVNVYDNTNDEPKTIKEKKSGWRINRIVDILYKVIQNK